MNVADLFVALTISNQAVAGSIIVIEIRECVLAGVLIVNGPTRSTKTMTQVVCVRLYYFGWEQAMFLACLLLHCHLTYLTSGT
jgi:hypothetical protein